MTAGTRQRMLIVNADDLGMADAVNRGIVAAHRRGIVTSATAMTNVPAAQRAAELVRREAPAMGLGLHVNLSFGTPVLPPEKVPSLVDHDGAFLSVTRGLGLPQHWNRTDIEAEVRAQFERFVAFVGRPPDHVDAHQLVSSLSIPCRAVVLELARTHGLAVRRSRTTWFGPLERLMSTRRALPGGLARLVDRIPRPWHQRPMGERTPLSTDGLDLRFFGENATVATLLRVIDELTEGVTELVCHPGYDGEEGDDYAYREAELAALTDPRVRTRIEEAGVALATFADLLPDPPGP